VTTGRHAVIITRDEGVHKSRDETIRDVVVNSPPQTARLASRTTLARTVG